MPLMKSYIVYNLIIIYSILEGFFETFENVYSAQINISMAEISPEFNIHFLEIDSFSIDLEDLFLFFNLKKFIGC